MHIDFQFYGKLCGTFHLFFKNSRNLRDFLFTGLYQKFIVYLKYKTGFKILIL